jgi:uncharacterized protein (TIGR02266 family)
MSARPSIILRRPVDAARDLLGECLGKLQDIAQPGVDVQPLVQKVAATVKTLFDIGPYDPLDPPHRAGIQTALQLISESLAMLQDVPGNDPAVFGASKSLAQVLSILYPISKAQQSMVPEARKPEPPRKEIPPHPRRTQTRIALNVDIGFQSENNFYTGFSEDISEGGIFLTTYDFKPIGTKMNITFTLPNGYVVMAAGTVRWIREYNARTPQTQPGMGVQFDALPPEDKAQIDEYIKTNSTMFYEA